MKKAILIVLALAAFLPATVSLADGVKRGGKVTHVASVDGVLLFTVSSDYIEDRFTGPSCASTQRFAVPEGSTHAGVVLTAFSTGKELGEVRGRGRCSLYSNAEDIRWIEICPVDGC